ncbi:MAG: DNA polymerase III subunit delta [Candidatus Caenarcaniphilales bacterium]|nr:DNA polymerase III subunit delta [Candidatus Caenarcaniphilales bacterium]
MSKLSKTTTKIQAQDNLLLLHGDDGFRVQIQLKELKSSLLDGASEISLINFSSKDDLNSQIFGLSLFALQKLIFINLEDFNLEALVGDLEGLLCQEGNFPDGVKVILHSSKKLDKRTKSFKALEAMVAKIYEVNQFSPWKPLETVDWLKKYAAVHQIKIERTALEKLVEFYGNDSATLVSELEKLYCYSAGAEIKLLDVKDNCESNQDLFALSDRLLDRDFVGFCRSAYKTITFGSPLPLLVGMQSVFSNFLVLKELSDEGKNSNQIAELTGKNPWKVGQDVQKLKRIDQTFLRRLFFALNKLEYEIKTGEGFDPALQMRFRILSLVS